MVKKKDLYKLVLKDKILMSPGIWNSTNFTLNSISKGIQESDLIKNNQLFIDHGNANKEETVDTYIGTVENIKEKDGVVIGDLIISDEITGKKVDSGANFGVSPKLELLGKDPANPDSFKVINWSLVITPAMDTTYINDTQETMKSLKEDKIMESEIKQEQPTAELAEWDTAFVNNLPDDAFAYISSGGEKDEEGKTKPRTLRHLPHHNMSVKNGSENESVDLPHLRNALARVSQTDISVEAQAEAKAHLDKHAEALLKTESKEEEVKEEVKTPSENSESAKVEEQKEVATLSAETKTEEVKQEVILEKKEETKVEELVCKKKRKMLEMAPEFASIVGEVTKLSPELGAKLKVLVEELEMPDEEMPMPEMGMAKQEPQRGLIELLELNEKLVSALEKQTKELELQKQDFFDLQKNILLLQKELEEYKTKEFNAKKEIVMKKIDNVASRYCKQFGISDPLIAQSLKESFSKFSEEELENKTKEIEAKEVTTMQETPVVQTRPSTELSGNAGTENLSKKEILRMKLDRMYGPSNIKGF